MLWHPIIGRIEHFPWQGDFITDLSEGFDKLIEERAMPPDC